MFKTRMNILILPFENSFRTHLARSWLPALGVFGVVFVFLFLVYQFAIYQGIPPDRLTRDPNDVSGLPFYTGFMTHLGVLMWVEAASFSFMGVILLFRKSRKFWLLLSGGAFTTLMVLDDAFELHEAFYPLYLHVPEKATYLIYLLLIAAFLVYFLRDILNDTDFPFLGASLLCMGVSIFFDQFMNVVFIEDGAKFMGIAFWSIYFSRTAVDQVHACMRAQKPRGE